VVTDVGDSAWIAGESGRVVQARDPEALRAAWAELIELGPTARRELGERARQRIRERFSVDEVVRQYEWIYEEQSGGA
jgi:glycosyltransferase involved in cell wall biosynthesis